MLIARNRASDWQQYNNAKQDDDNFVLTPASSGNLKQFINIGTRRDYPPVWRWQNKTSA